MTIPLRCRCGTVRGTLDPGRVYARATCYCKDCRAFARYLGAADVLDASGGTDIAPVAPSALRITDGVAHVACMSLSPNGLLRWYASCCRTPLANTPREPKLPYVGVVSACLDATAPVLDAALGPRGRVAIAPASATAPVKSTPLAYASAVARIVAGVAGARLRRDRVSPFFDASGQPRRAPHVITREQRAALQ